METCPKCEETIFYRKIKHFCLNSSHVEDEGMVRLCKGGCGRKVWRTHRCIICVQYKELDKEKIDTVIPWTTEQLLFWQKENQDYVEAHRRKLREQLEKDSKLKTTISLISNF